MFSFSIGENIHFSFLLYIKVSVSFNMQTYSQLVMLLLLAI